MTGLVEAPQSLKCLVNLSPRYALEIKRYVGNISVRIYTELCNALVSSRALLNQCIVELVNRRMRCMFVYSFPKLHVSSILWRSVAERFRGFRLVLPA